MQLTERHLGLYLTHYGYSISFVTEMRQVHVSVVYPGTLYTLAS